VSGLLAQGTDDLFLDLGGTTAHSTSASSSNETDLLTRRRVSSHGSSVTDVLMVTTTVRVLHGVHGHTAHHGPAVTLALYL